MEMVSLTTALIFGLVSVYIIFFIARALLGGLIGDPRGWGEKRELKRKEARLEEAEELLNREASGKAIGLLKDAFCLAHIRSSLTLIDRSGGHNMSVLGRIVTVSHKHSRSLGNLPVIEDLIQSRHQLLRAYYDSVQSKREFARGRSGKNGREWALAEYTKKIAEAKDKIQTNRRSIESQLGELLKNLENLTEEDDVTYH